MQKVHRHLEQGHRKCPRGSDCLSVFWFRSFSLPLRGFFSPFLHSTCALSISKAYVGLEGGSPVFKQWTFYFFIQTVGSYRTFTFFGAIFKKLLQSVSMLPVPLSFANTHGISVDFFSCSYWDVSVHYVSSLLWFSTLGIAHFSDTECLRYNVSHSNAPIFALEPRHPQNTSSVSHVAKDGVEPSTAGLWVLCSNQSSYLAT